MTINLSPTERGMVCEFHERFGVAAPDKPAFPSQEVCGLRDALIWEEYCEWRDAIENGDLVATADALADLLYVVHGAAIAFGIDIEPIFAEVHRSNCTKEGGGTRPDGKILKGPGYEAPDIAAELTKQGWAPCS